MRFLIQWRIMPNATWLNHHIDNYYISNERSLRISLFIHTHLQQSSLRIFFSPPFLFSLISLAGKGIPLCSGKKKPIGTDARPLTDNPTWVLSQTNCKWFGHLVWRVACGRRARDYSRIRHRRSLEISVCMYTCLCMCVCVWLCVSQVFWRIKSRQARNRSGIEERGVKQRESDEPFEDLRDSHSFRRRLDLKK